MILTNHLIYVKLPTIGIKMESILEKIYDLLPADKQHRGNGWIHFNCPCCYHVENPDHKSRGNILFLADGFVYQCFNCHFTCGYHLGQYFSKNTMQFLKDLDISPKDLNDLLLTVREYNESNTSNTVAQPIVRKREIRPLPTNYKSIQESLAQGDKSETLKKVVQYLYNRNSRLMEWDTLYWAEKQNNFLIPCREYGEIVGYSLRNINDTSDHKYTHYIPQGFVYNYDNLLTNRKYEILVEGQTDALAINGIAYLGSTLTNDRLKRLLPFTNDKELIICPDRDNAGKKIVKQVLDEDLPFSIAFPDWTIGIKDCEDAVKKYGRLYTIYSIITSKESNKSLINLKSMKWFQQ